MGIQLIKERPREILPGFEVGRVLPTPPLMHVGPFVFLDHMGPLLADVSFPGASELRLPKAPELAAFVVGGAVQCEDATAAAGTLLVFEHETAPLLRTSGPARVAVFGGEPLDGPRFIWWNFVNSSQEQIVEAARAWRERRWPLIPGDEEDFVPYDREPHFPKS